MKNNGKLEEPLVLDMPFDEALERFARVNTKAKPEPAPLGAAPFVKWVGGKRSIIADLVARVPETFKRYYEPFVGGGALFFELAGQGRIASARLSDKNFELVITYNAVKSDPERLLVLLEEHERKHGPNYYLRIRAQHSLQDPLAIAARFIYLNKTCYNGLYRVNRRGEFNVPMGRYANPGIVAADNIMACSRALRVAEIEYRDFDTIAPGRGDFAYFDPPYHPLDSTSFTNYTKLDFGQQDQIRLRDFALALHGQGVKVMLSNSDTAFIRDLYSKQVFKLAAVHAPRMVNCKAESRGAVSELLITNY